MNLQMCLDLLPLIVLSPLLLVQKQVCYQRHIVHILTKYLQNINFFKFWYKSFNFLLRIIK